MESYEKAISNIIRIYCEIVLALEEIYQDGDSAAYGWKSKFCSLNFGFIIHGYLDILKVLQKCSLKFQKKAAFLSELDLSFQIFINELTIIKNNENLGANFEEFINKKIDSKTLSWKNIKFNLSFLNPFTKEKEKKNALNFEKEKAKKLLVALIYNTLVID